MRTKLRLFCSFAYLVAPSLAYAGAWTQDQGSGLLIVSGSYYSSSHYWDNSGTKQSQATYGQYILNPYFEYGLRDDLTIGTNLLLERLNQNTIAGTDTTNWGIGDSEFFVRKRLWNQNGFVVSAEPMIKLPSPESPTSLPRIGSSTPDAGLGLSGGYGFSADGLNHFADVDTQYRYRFGDQHDQVRVNGTIGISVSPLWMIMPQTFITLRTGSSNNSTFTDSPADDYNLIRLQLSAVYKASDTISMQFGGFSDVDGKNVGEGNGVLIALRKSM